MAGSFVLVAKPDQSGRKASVANQPSKVNAFVSFMAADQAAQKLNKAKLRVQQQTTRMVRIGKPALAAVFQRISDVATRSVTENSKDLEFMLTSQAIALDSIFNRLAIQAQANIGKHPKAADTYLRLALKAQSQCRATSETLATLKSPRQYINQTNVAGAMQINIEMEGVQNDIKGSCIDTELMSNTENFRPLSGVDGK